MMAVTHAPSDLVVAVSDGIDIRFAGVALETAPPYVGLHAGEPGIHVQVTGVRGPETQRRDARLGRQRQAWVDQRQVAESGSAGAPPEMPGVSVLQRVAAQLSDDAGTVYRRAGGSMAGDGMDWEAVWVFVPEPPPAATTLRLDFTVDGDATGKHCTVDLGHPDEAAGPS